jgi:hypothetical protein
MFVCVRPSISLFQLSHVLWWFRKGSGLIGAYYFQPQAKSLIVYIVPTNCGLDRQARQLGGDPKAAEGLRAHNRENREPNGPWPDIDDGAV